MAWIVAAVALGALARLLWLSAERRGGPLAVSETWIREHRYPRDGVRP